MFYNIVNLSLKLNIKHLKKIKIINGNESCANKIKYISFRIIRRIYIQLILS